MKIGKPYIVKNVIPTSWLEEPMLGPFVSVGSILILTENPVSLNNGFYRYTFLSGKRFVVIVFKSSFASNEFNDHLREAT